MLMDLAGSQEYWIPPQVLAEAERKAEEKGVAVDYNALPRFYYRPPSGREYLAWRRADRIVEERERTEREDHGKKVLELLADRVVRIKGEGTPGEMVKIEVGPWFLEGKDLDEIRAFVERRDGEEQEKEEGEEAAKNEAMLEEMADKVVYHEALVGEDGSWDMIWRPMTFRDYIPDFNNFEHHIELALLCITRVEGIAFAGEKLDWKNPTQVRELTGWDHPRREILMRTGQAPWSYKNLVDLALTIVQGMSSGQKKS